MPQLSLSSLCLLSYFPSIHRLHSLTIAKGGRSPALQGVRNRGGRRLQGGWSTPHQVRNLAFALPSRYKSRVSGSEAERPKYRTKITPNPDPSSLLFFLLRRGLRNEGPATNEGALAGIPQMTQ